MSPVSINFDNHTLTFLHFTLTAGNLVLIGGLTALFGLITGFVASDHRASNPYCYDSIRRAERVESWLKWTSIILGLVGGVIFGIGAFIGLSGPQM
jgi:hypothetical protein